MKPIDNVVTLKLKEPYWGAWKKFGWPKGTAGFGVRQDKIEVCLNAKKKLLVTTRGISYVTGPADIETFLAKQGSIPKYTTSKGVNIIVLPQSIFQEMV